jgi:hypothetical protein
MRNAIIFGNISIPKIRGLSQIRKAAKTLDGLVEEFYPQDAAYRILQPICADAFHYNLCATLWLGPHTDDDIIGDITVGVIIEGDHYMFTGNGRKVGDLVSGTVFALLNKKLHGAYPLDRKNIKPLIFATCEPKVPVEDWRRFCSEMKKSLNKA